MQTEQLKEHLAQALSSEDAQTEVNRVCRAYLKEYLQGKLPKKMPDLIPVVDLISYPVKYEVEAFKKDMPARKPQYVNANVWYIGVATVIASLLGEMWFDAPIIGAAVGFVVGKCILDAYVKRYESNTAEVIAVGNTAKLKAITTVDEITQQVLKYAQALGKLTDEIGRNIPAQGDTDVAGTQEEENLLESKYVYVLQWFHKMQLVRMNDEWLMNDIASLLNLLGYELVEYTDEMARMFKITAGHVEMPTTSVKALINSKTKKCIAEGVVIMPM